MNRVNLDETGKARRKLLVKSQRLQRSLRQLSHFLLRLSCDAVSGSWADATGPESCFNEGNLLTVALNVCWLLPAAWLHSVCDWSLSTLSARRVYLHICFLIQMNCFKTIGIYSNFPKFPQNYFLNELFLVNLHKVFFD